MVKTLPEDVQVKNDRLFGVVYYTHSEENLFAIVLNRFGSQPTSEVSFNRASETQLTFTTSPFKTYNSSAQ